MDTLWSCPKCGARLARPNLWHACGAYSVGSFLAGKGEKARSLFAEFRRLAESCGPDVEPAPAKTRVAFVARIRFCAVNGLSDRGLSAHLLLRRAHPSPRFRRIDKLGDECFVHHFRATEPSQLDDEVREWLRESYETMGR